MSCRRWMVVFLLGALGHPTVALAQADSLPADVALLKAAGVDTDGEGLLKFFKKRTLADETRKKIEDLIVQLGDDKYDVRAKAQRALVEVGLLARPMLVNALRGSDPEVLRRARWALLKIGPTTEESQLLPAAARALADRKPAGAAAALLNVLPCIEDLEVAEEVAHSLPSLTLDKDKKVVQAVVLALKDRYAIKRFAAGEALARVGGKDQREAVRKLLHDTDTGVRRRVALALLESKDKEAIPALIKLLSATTSEDVVAAEEALFLLAGEKAPNSPDGDSALARQKYVKSWEDWWKTNEAKVDLKKFDLALTTRGYTLFVTMDRRGLANGAVYETDAAGKVRWKITGLRYPVYANMIRNDRVLICEYYGNKVTERDTTGKIHWEKAVSNQLLSAQRLRNGNTFIVMRNQLLEVDKSNKEIRTISRPYDVVAANKDPDGKITLITTNSLIRLDSTGKQLSSVSLGGYIGTTLGFKAHFLPRGGVVIPNYSFNKVREYDAKGKMVWEADATRPNSAVKLPNGNVLLASRFSNKVWEIDRKGKEVSSKTADGMPVVADRR